MKNIIIIGAGGHGKVVAELALLNKYNYSFWDDSTQNIFQSSIPISKRSLILPPDTNIVIGIGDNISRKRISFDYSNDYFINLVHPRSILSDDFKLGVGNVIMAAVSINPGVCIGNHNILNTGSVIEHDCKLGNYIHISPNATLCGNVIVNDGAWIGAGSTIIPGVKVGEGAIIGAGAVVLKDVLPYVTVVGNPARVIKSI